MNRWTYFDSSAIVKLVQDEPESLALVDYLQEPMQVCTSVISEVEVTRTLRRRNLPATEVDAALKGFFLLALEHHVRDIAAQIGPETLRSLDAIHLASALGVGDPSLEFVTYDRRQAAAARENGLRVVQPGR